jgi:hypothetical protein
MRGARLRRLREPVIEAYDTPEKRGRFESTFPIYRTWRDDRAEAGDSRGQSLMLRGNSRSSSLRKRRGQIRRDGSVRRARITARKVLLV